MNSARRWRRRLGARLAKPRTLFLDAASADGFADWCAAHAGQAAELIVSARLLHELVCEPGLPLEDGAAVEAYARQLFGHYFGAAAQRWPLAAWQAGSANTAQRGASALHGLDWTALRSAAEVHDVELRRVRPAWAPLLQRLAVDEPEWLRGPRAALAWVEGPVLTWLVLREGRLDSLRQLRLPAPTQAALGETLAELLAGPDSPAGHLLVLGYGLEAATPPVWPGARVLGRLDAAAPDTDLFQVPAKPLAGLPQPDFLGTRPAHSMLAWPLAATGLLVLATAGWSSWGSHQALQEAQDRLARSERLQSSERRAPVRPAAAPAAAGSRSVELERLRGAREVQGLLQQAWEPLLGQVEQAGAGQVSWLALDYSAGRNELRLEGLTPDQPAALQLVDRLAAAPGWRDVVLSRFQSADQGLIGQRFEVSAKLRPELLQPALLPRAKDAP